MWALLLAALVGCGASSADLLARTPNATGHKEETAPASGDCSLYKDAAAVIDNCASGCGRCFNAGARQGTKCNGAGSQTGYYCPADPTDVAGGDVTFACMDWTFGSSAMRAAEEDFNKNNGEDVYFGIGTYGTSDDAQHGLGACYRLQVEGVDKDIIAQSVNTGHDVAGNQFDMQIGAGGAGAFNTCAGGGGSMYPGERAAWGCVYGGVDSRESCADLPSYPRDGTAMKAASDSLVSLCQYGWDKKVRLSGAGQPAGACKYNPTLVDVSRVRCPNQLVEMTQFQRKDEPPTFKAEAAWRPTGMPNLDLAHKCRAQEPGAGVEYCLTRMMDCRKPSGGFIDNVRPELMVPGRKVVQTCKADGYTRIDVACGCEGCYC